MRLLHLLSLVSPWALLLASLVSLGAAAAGICLLGSSAWLIASAALLPPLSALALGITGVRACGIFRAVFRYGERYISHRLAFHGLTKIRVSLYKKAALLLPLRRGVARQGELLHDLLAGADELRDFFVRGMLPPVTAGILTVCITYWLARHTDLFWLLPLLFILRLEIPFLIWQKSHPDSRQLDGAYRSALMDMGAGLDELYLAGSASARGILRQAAEEKLQGDKKARLVNDKGDTLLNILDAFVVILLMASMIPAVALGDLSGIDFAVYFLVLQTLLLEFRMLPEAMRQIQRSNRAACSLWPSREQQANGGQREQLTAHKQSCSPEQKQALLWVEDLCFSYGQGQNLLSRISFSIQQGQHTAIVGASGSGKTTLTQLLLGVWPPDKGGIYWQGKSYLAMDVENIRKNISAMPQGSVLFAKSIRENFRILCPDIEESDMWQALQDAQLDTVVKSMAQGLDTPLGQDACDLSGGQRSCLLTALSIAGTAPLIILDEPTCGLDKQRALKLMESLWHRMKAREQTLVVITHEEELTKKFSQVIHL